MPVWMDRIRPWKTVFVLSAAIFAIFLITRFEAGSIGAASAVPTPTASGAMTVYSVTNSNAAPISVNHVITNTTGFHYAFTSSVPANSTVEYHTRDMASVPSPFTGSVTLTSDQTFVSQIIGYDYPAAATKTPTSTLPQPTATNTPASAPPPATSTPRPSATSTSVPPSTATPPAANTATPPSNGNVAQGRYAWASSTASGSAASASVDGNLATYWTSNGGGTQWLAVDLGAAYSISKVNIKWTSAYYAKYYFVEYSNDGTTWRPVWTITSGTGNESLPTGGSTRYLRIRATTGANTTAYQLAELEVLSTQATSTPPQPTATNTPAPTQPPATRTAVPSATSTKPPATSTPLPSATSTSVPPSTATPPPANTATPSSNGNVAQGRYAWASSTASSSTAGTAVDGNLATSWTSNSGGTQWLAVDLGASYPISRVNIKWVSAYYAKYYFVEYSNDGTTWRPVWTITSGTGNESLPVGGSTRYLRVRATTGANTTAYKLAELEVTRN